MPDFKLPLSGDVSQIFKLWTNFFSAMGSQFGLINISLGKSSNPKVEDEVLSNVGSYGKQLGRVEEALAVLVAHLPPDEKLSEAEKAAIADFKQMFNNVADVKYENKKEGDKVLFFKDNLTPKLDVKS